ncbi:MAG TPA: hypothetical protein VFL60_02815 [Gaiellaceae bacterium]|nr:hypothetical protein [Gaiellaceae bacterium]
MTLVVATFFVSFGALHYGFYTRGLLLDTPVYERYGDAIVHARVPYRDFGVEYPPAALPVFAAPSLVAPARDFDRYRAAFETLMLLCGGVAAALVGLVVRERRVAATLLAGLAPLALGPVVLSRFDLWPAMLSVAGLAALVGGGKRVASALLGVALAAKIYPGVLVPLAVVYVWRRHGRREAVVCAAAAAAAALAWFVPFLVVAPHGVWSSVAGQASRPLQIESLGAALLLGAHQAWGLPLAQVSSHGSDNLAGGLPHAFAVAQGVLAPLALLALWIAFARGPATRERLLRYAAACVCAFVVLGKVLSPQYLIWLIPLVPLVRSTRAWILFVAALVLTQLWFPRRYLDLAYGFDARASWLVLARDLVLVALLLVLVVPRRALVLPVAAAALAAAGAAAAGVASPRALAHSTVLAETGVPSACDAAPAVPSTSAQTVRYAVRGFENDARRTRCAVVTVRSTSGAPLFSAAYRQAFLPADPTRNLLGHAGTCTNVAQHPRAAVGYAFRVPPRTRFAVEVEHCTESGAVPAYAVRVSWR